MGIYSRLMGRCDAVEIYGTMSGSISTNGKVVVALTGYCRSDIKAHSLEILGEVHGEVQVDNLILQPTGRFYGRATYANLIRHSGSVFSTEDDSLQYPTEGTNRKEPQAGRTLPGPVFYTSF